MIIDGIVVLFNPSKDVINNIKSYQPLLNKLFVVDNSNDINKEVVDDLTKLDNVIYYSLNGNKGIAKALKEGMKLSISDKADMTLTMDQDSIFPTDKFDDIVHILSENINKYAIIGLNFNSTDVEKKLVETNLWLTSGNFINNSDYLLIEGFKEELFIDWVDFDLCEQFYTIGKKVAYINEISIKHTIGNPIEFKFFGKTKHAMNHSLIRYYYRYRNGLYLYKKNKKFYRKKYLHDLYIDKKS